MRDHMIEIRQKDGVMQLNITPDGVKLLAAFAAAASGSPDPVTYQNCLSVLVNAPRMTDEELTSWSTELSQRFFGSGEANHHSSA